MAGIFHARHDVFVFDGFILFLINFCLRGRNYVRVPTRVLSHTSNMDTTASRNKFAYFIFSGWLSKCIRAVHSNNYWLYI